MLGKMLFTAQLIAMVLCAFPLTLRLPLPLTLGFLVLSGALFLWVLGYNRLGNWSVFPQPRTSSQLIKTGPYGWMRHPMYSALMLGAFALVLHNQTLQSVTALCALIGILNIKARYEEKLLKVHFSDYEHYQSSVQNRFIPKLF